MDKYNYVDYIITQTGTKLTCDSTIKIVKYENKVSRLVFKVEDRLKQFRLYFAIQNPITERYHYEPLLFDGEDYYLVVGTSISYYAKENTKSTKLKGILIAVQPSFILDDNITIDDTATIYASEEFVKIVILNTFLNDYATDVSMPNLDMALDNFMVLHDDVVQLSVQTAQDLVDCNVALKQCENDVEICNNSIINNQAILSESRSVFLSCQNILSQCQNLLDNMNTQYNNYMASMQSAYIEYINSIRQGGEP